MGEIDRIQPVQPAIIQSQVSSSVQMRKEGRQQGQEREESPHDILELHENEPDETEATVEIEDGPEDHGLDLTA